METRTAGGLHQGSPTVLSTFTICICTRNRAQMLARALASLAKLETPNDIDWDVLVVDNASDDGTPEVAGTFAERLNLRVVSEQRAGVSHARNRVLDLCESEVMLWIDDDVTVRPNWLSACANGLRRFPEAAFAGGPIVARFEGKSEKWVSAVWRASVGSAFAWYEPTAAECKVGLNDKLLPWGANMAIRRSAVGDLRFDPSLGRQPGHLVLCGEESSFFRGLLQRGGHGCWLPEMRVDHHIAPDRANEKWIEAYFHGQGWKNAARRANRNANLEQQVRRKRVKLRRCERWYHRLRLRFAPLDRQLAYLRHRALLRGFIQGSREGMTGRPKKPSRL